MPRVKVGSWGRARAGEASAALCPQVSVSFGGLSIKKDEEVLKKKRPHVVVGTPGSILALARSRSLSLRGVRHFVLDERDKMLEQPGARQRGLGRGARPAATGTVDRSGLSAPGCLPGSRSGSSCRT